MVDLGLWPVSPVRNIAKCCYNFSMQTKNCDRSLESLLKPLTDCLTPESARRLVKLKADPKLQARIDELAEKCSAGSLSTAERLEYEQFVSYGTFVDILKSKARLLLANSRTVS